MLADFVPDDVFIAPRLMEEVAENSPFIAAEKEALSGALIAVAGGLPILVHEAAAAPALLDALEAAGVARPGSVETYSSRAQYLARIKVRQSAGERVWFTFPVPEWMGQDGETLASSKVIAALNDRRALERLVPEAARPVRRVLEGTAAVEDGLAALRPGQVAKLAGAPASSGGAQVQLVHNRRHVARARNKLKDAEAIVIEDLVPSRRSICAQVAIMADQTTLWVGASDQLLTRSGLYLGNRISTLVPDAFQDLAIEIADRAAREGFAGIAGFDLLDTANGPIAVDLNFRPNGSTPFLLLYEGLAKSRGLALAEFTFARRAGSLESALKVLAPAIDDGWLIPTCAFDPALAGIPDAPVSLRVIVMAASERQLLRHMKTIAAMGFRLPAHPQSFFRKLFGRAVEAI